MHPTISYYLAQARMADLRHDARRAARARAARRTRPEHCEHSGPRLHGWTAGCCPCWAPAAPDPHPPIPAGPRTGPAPWAKGFPCQPQFALPLLSR